jgi:septal ring factor EnvC (AmiA/AmiB activator)
MDYQAEITKIEKTLEERKLEHAKLTERLANITKEIEKYEIELKTLGIETVNLESYIKQEEENLTKTIAEIKTKLEL